MTTFHSNEDVTDFNQGALEELTRAIEWNNEGQFALILARCNSSNVRRRLVQSLQKLCSVEIREIVLNKSVKTLYTTIQTELSQSQEQPQALMVSGLESVIALDQLLTGANQVREEFRKNFHFPLVWWVTDEVLQKLIRLAPDFQSWATAVEFEIATDELIQFIQQTANEVFTRVLETGAGIFLDNTALNLGIGSPLRAELESGQKELQLRGVQLDLQLEASLEFVLGRVADGFQEQSRQHYERSLDLWQCCPNWERVGCVLYSLGLWWYSYAVKHRAEYEQACDRTKDYFQQCIQVFDRYQRNDLVAKFINALGEILQRLQQWDELETVAEKALALHRTYPDPFRLARAHGFLAEVQLAKSDWTQARESAEQAFSIFKSAASSSLTSVSSEMNAHLDLELSYHQGWYLFSLAKAQKGLSQSQDSLKSLETALAQTKPQYDPQLFIRILKELRDEYFKQGEYLKAFGFKQDQRAIEGQYGFRAFIGAGRLRPSQQVTNPALTLGESQGTIPQEITASGRQEDVNKLLVRISRPDHKLTVIYGQSGVGKSSLLQAGLIPALKQKSIGICDVSVVLQQVYTDWFRELSQHFKDELERLKEFRGIVLLSETLDSTEALLKQLQENAEQNLLTVLIFDQFEEFFFVCKDHTQRDCFYDFLQRSLQCPSVKVILSLREDYLHYLLEFNRVCNLEVINNNILDKDIIYYLGNFSQANAESIIQSLTKQAQLTLEPSLINELIQDLSRELGEVRPIELQVVGAQLQTENITTLTQYRGHGLKGKLVQRYLEELVEDCGPENQQVAQTLLYLLTDENNTRPLKTRVDLEGALKSLADAEKTQKLDLVLEIFVQSGLVVLLPEITANRYQLVHDYLVSFIRQQQNTELIEKLKEAEEQKKEAEEQKRLSEARRKISEAKLNTFLKWALAGSLIAGLILTVLTVVSVRSARQARNSEFKARSSYTTAQNSEFEARSSYAEALFTSNKELEALIESLKLGQQLKQAGGLAEDTKVRALTVLQKVVYGVRERNRLLGHNYGVYSVSFSPDGQTIVSASADNTLKLWGLDGSLLTTTKDHAHTDNVIGATFSPDGQTIASASADKTVKLWRRNGTLLKTLNGHSDDVYSVSFSPDGQTIASASKDKTVKLWRRDSTLLKTLNGHTDTVLCASFSRDGQTIASASADKTVKLWRRDGTLLKTLNGHSDDVYSVSFSPDGQTIASASKDNTVRLWRRDGILIRVLQGHGAGVRSVSFSRDGKTIASSSADNTVKLWRLDGTLLRTLQGHSNVVTSVSFSPNGKTIASASTDATVKLWNVGSSLFRTLYHHRNSVNSISFSPDGKIIASASTDLTVKLWTRDGTLINSLMNAHKGSIWSISFSLDGKIIASASADKTVRLWRRDGILIRVIPAHNKVVTSVSFSPDGQTIASASTEGTVKLWRLDGTRVRTIQNHCGEVWNVRFSPDGQTIASGCADKTIKLWKRDGTLLRTLKGHSSAVRSISFSPDGQTLASASFDKTIKIWSWDGKLRNTLQGHNDGVKSVSFSPDGQTIVSGSVDATVKLWRLDGQLLKTLQGHSNRVNSVSFSPDGKTIASASTDNTVILWEWQQWSTHLDELLLKGCNWARDYLKNNPNVSESDRNLCDGIGTQN